MPIDTSPSKDFMNKFAKSQPSKLAKHVREKKDKTRDKRSMLVRAMSGKK